MKFKKFYKQKKDRPQWRRIKRILKEVKICCGKEKIEFDQV